MVELPSPGVDVAVQPELAVLVDAAAHIGEGPVWDEREGALYWVNIERNELHRFRPSTGLDEVADVGRPVGAVGLRRGSGLVLALQGGFGTVDAFGASVRMLAEVEADKLGNRMNDGKPDAAGRFWAGSLAMDGSSGAGALYRLDPDGTVTRHLTGVGCSNGLDWSLDGKTMYYVDSLAYSVFTFDFDMASGELGPKHVLIRFEVGEGAPDGLTVDSNGHIWVAHWGGWAVTEHTPDGVERSRLAMPVRQPSSCCFGGEDYADLYITSAAKNLDPSQLEVQPHAGALFRIRVDAKGHAPGRFAG